MSIYPGPQPPYTNPPIHPEYFEPSRFEIIGITLGITTTITTLIPHNYVIGQEIRCLIPDRFGTRGLDEETGFVLTIPAPNQVKVNIVSIGDNPFIPNPPAASTRPQIVAIGDLNSGIISATGRVVPTTHIPGSFRNISPFRTP